MEERRLKLARYAICILLSLTMITALVYELHEQDHDCCGEDCAICAVISSYADTLSGGALHKDMNATRICLYLLMISLLAVIGIPLQAEHSLVASKVQLNN